MSVLLIDCYVDIPGGAGNFLPLLPPDTMVWKAVHEKVPSSFDNVSGIVITGSAACIGDGDSWLQELSDFLTQSMHQQIPCFGVCFGHQILAHISGSLVGKMSQPEVGWKTIQVQEEASLFAGVSGTFGCFLSHEDGVLFAGDEIDVLASSDECAVQAFRHKSYPVYGIQFHPEMPLEESRALLRYRAEKHPQLNIDVLKEEKLLIDNADVAKTIFGNFLSMLS
jgi:GMP synthase (glutamine-hydrolysing)